MRRNGIDVEQLDTYIQLLRANPQVGALTGRNGHDWAGGYTVNWRADEISVAGQHIARDHSLSIDMPKELGGEDSGPTPGELLGAALGACVAQQFVEHAARRGIDVEHVEVACTADGDIRGMFEIGDARPGFDGLSVSLRVHADANDALLDELLQAAVRTSPIADSVANPVPVHPELQRR